jgi:arabinogalactan endo-1,4-beta-galactosidase
MPNLCCVSPNPKLKATDMNINEAFPSNYLKAADLQGRTITVKISHVTSEKLGDDNKLIIYFEGKQKGMVLNKTNANNLAFAFGPETDDWQGAEAQLYPTMVDFQGRSVEALRIKPVPMRRSTSHVPTRQWHQQKVCSRDQSRPNNIWSATDRSSQ